MFSPSRETGMAEMAVSDGNDTGIFEWYRNTVIPPKASFLPNMEKMFSFGKGEGSYRLESPAPAESR
jgi:hypothetical protein